MGARREPDRPGHQPGRDDRPRCRIECASPGFQIEDSATGDLLEAGDLLEDAASHRRVCGLWSVSTRRFCRVTTASLIAQPSPSRQGRAGTTPELPDIAATALAWWERPVQAAGISPMVGDALVDRPTADCGVSRRIWILRSWIGP
jgi:hypothetical protein